MVGGEYDLLTESAAESPKGMGGVYADEPKSAMLASQHSRGLAQLKKEFGLLSEAAMRGGMTDSPAAGTNPIINLVKVRDHDVDSQSGRNLVTDTEYKAKEEEFNGSAGATAQTRNGPAGDPKQALDRSRTAEAAADGGDR